MTIKHSKDSYRTTKTGKRVLVHGHDYEVEEEFDKLFGEAKTEPQPDGHATTVLASYPGYADTTYKVAKIGTHGYSVTVWDDDSGQAAGSAMIFKTEADADAKAEELAKKSFPSAKGSEPKPGNTVEFDQLKIGMTFQKDGWTHTITGKTPTGGCTFTSFHENHPDVPSVLDVGAEQWSQMKDALPLASLEPPKPDDVDAEFDSLFTNHEQAGDVDAEFANLFSGAAPESTTAPEPAKPPITPSGITKWSGKSTPDVTYGSTLVKFGKNQLTPAARIYLPHSGEQLKDFTAAGINAHWMPINKCYEVVLGGMPSASGKVMAEKLDAYLQAKCGAPNAKNPPPSPADKIVKKIDKALVVLTPGQWNNIGGTKVERSTPTGKNLFVTISGLNPRQKEAIKALCAGATTSQGSSYKVPFSLHQSLAHALASGAAPPVPKPSMVTTVGTSAPAKVYKKGETVPWNDIQPGMELKTDVNTSYVMKEKKGDVWTCDFTNHDYPEEGTYSQTLDAEDWNGFSDAFHLTKDASVQLHVGNTKIENGKTYVLNVNHKWELAPTSAAQVKVYHPGNSMDGWKQVGPQKGSNPGGLYEDAYGKKWYVKFPPSEAHAKNELLAAKLYKACGIDAPSLKLVEKGGKVGIASAWVEGLDNVKSGALLAKQNGAKEGFGADAWLANWDSVGMSFDNMPVGNDGKAVRIDVGGALAYRAQGSPKGDAFGNVVPEIDTLRDSATNPNTAAVFGMMTPTELDDSIAKVLELPDDHIQQIVAKYGPGTDAEKKALAQKLITRKAYLAKKFPLANLIANPPAPDPRKLKVDAAKLPGKLDFLNWNGQGKGLSTVPAVNEANQHDFNEVYALAVKGDLVALKEYQWTEIDKSTGKAIGKKSVSEHKSQYFKDWMTQTLDHMEGVAYPAAKKAKTWDDEDVTDIRELSDAFKPHFYGVSVAKVPANERLGFWISLGKVTNPKPFLPKATFTTKASDKAKGKADTAKMPSILRSWMKSVKGYGGANQPYRDGKETDNEGRNCRDVLQAAYAHATEFEAGTVIRKGIYLGSEMLKQMQAAPDGHVFQNPGSMCCSLTPNHNWSGDVMLEMVYAKGAQGLYNIGVGAFDHEGEITSLPGQRYMILSRGTEPYDNGTRPKFTVLVLPPDKTYIDNIKPAKKAA